MGTLKPELNYIDAAAKIGFGEQVALLLALAELAKPCVKKKLLVVLGDTISHVEYLKPGKDLRT